MSYHDRNQYKTRWRSPKNDKEPTQNPRIKILSPQKKLFDIEQILKSLPETPMTVVELQEAIQRIIDGR